jgi:threonine dehydratase
VEQLWQQIKQRFLSNTTFQNYDDIEVIAGQATIAKELLEQNPKMDRVFIPVGGRVCWQTTPHLVRDYLH